MLGNRHGFGRFLDPLDAADGGLQVRTAGRVPYALHPTARMIDAPDMTLATRRASEPVRVAVSGVAPTLSRVSTISDKSQIVTALPGSSPSAPEDVTPRVPGTVWERGPKLTPLPVADPTQAARPDAPAAPSSTPDRRADILWLGGLLAVLFVLSR